MAAARRVHFHGPVGGRPLGLGLGGEGGAGFHPPCSTAVWEARGTWGWGLAGGGDYQLVIMPPQ